MRTGVYPYDEEEVIRQLQNPSLEFVPEDRTLDAWLYRISLWGKVTFLYRNDKSALPKELTEKQVIKKLSSDLNTKGRWSTKRIGIDTLVMKRTWSERGKSRWEEITLVVDLRPELKRESLWKKVLRFFGIGK